MFRYFEAAEIYLEGGLIREAIDCLLAGQYFEEAYLCYQELFKLQTKDSTFSSLTTTNNSKIRSLSPISNKSNNPTPLVKSSLSFFGKQKSESSSTSNTVSSLPLNPLHQPPPRSDGGSLADSDRLTIDDHITIFLLRLYLYDPVKYEYPSPIIPLPADLVQTNPNLKLTNRTNVEDEELDESVITKIPDKPISSSSSSSASVSLTGQTNLSHGNQPNFRISDTFLPFIDFLNCRLTERSISDLIELNMLLETLYLSYRNELRHTIDHDYANAGDDTWSSSTEDSDSESDDEDLVTAAEYITPTPNTSEVKCSTNFSSYEMKHDLRASEVGAIRHDSIDDDPPTTTTTTTKSSTSGSSSLFEKDNLDDIGYKLEQLVLKFVGTSVHSNKKTSKSRPLKVNADNGGCIVDRKQDQQSQIVNTEEEEEAEIDFSELERKVAFQQRMMITEGDNDQQLRIQIASKLFPLLNSHQNQLVYLILSNKD